jgi:hypothetical protein
MSRLPLFGLLFAPVISSAVTIQIVADNDFAIFVGSSSAPTRLAYQNDNNWPSQIAAASSYNLTFGVGEDTVYLLAMGGGGGEENVSGNFNGHSLVNLTGVQASSNISGGLSGYSMNSVEDGSYAAFLEDVTASLAAATWSSPTVGVQGVIWMSGNAAGFIFPTGHAIVYRFSAEQILVPIPEPSTYGLILGGLALAGAAIRRRRKQSA